MLKRVLVAIVLMLSLACSSTSKTEVADTGEHDAGAGTTNGATAETESGAPGDVGSASGRTPTSGATGETSARRPSADVGGDATSIAPTGLKGTLKLGVHLSANAAAASAFGVPLPVHSPEKVDAVIKWVNANGGIAGRRVVPVYHTTDPLKGSFDSQAQETCTALTQDHKVDIAIGAAQLYRDSLPACFAQNHTPFVWNVYYLTQRNVVPSKYLYRPAQPHADRLGFVIDGLFKHGFFRNAKIGLIRYDSPKEKHVADTVIKPALAAHGLKLAAEAAVKEPDGASGAGDTAAESSNVALRFRQNAISHVLFVPSGGAIPLLFLNAAESQHYRPRYGLSSADAPYFVRDSVPASQLEGAAGVGWGPLVDLGPTNTSAQKFSEGSRLCLSIATKAGFTPDEMPGLYCDMLFFLKAALSGTTSVTADALAAGTASRASGYRSATTYAAKFGPGRHDGTAKARTFVWDDDWKYVGQPYSVD